MRFTGAVARVSLARTERQNAFDEALIAALNDAFARLVQDPAVRAVVLSGEGKSFCAGVRLWDDGVIDPADTRAVGALSLAASLQQPVGETQFGTFRM